MQQARDDANDNRVGVYTAKKILISLVMENLKDLRKGFFAKGIVKDLDADRPQL